MKAWAWILGLGGAFTAFAGYMASRAKAQVFLPYTAIVFVPNGTVNTAGATLDAATAAAQALMTARGGTSADIYYQPDATNVDLGTKVRSLNAQGQVVS